MAEALMVDAINRALRQALAQDDRVVVMGQDVGKLGGVFRVTDGLQDEFGSRRVFDTPLAESGIVGTAFGMSLTGMIPVAEVQFMGFIYKCLDQLVAQAGQIRARTWGQMHAPLVVRTAYGGGVRTPEHHSDSLEALLIGSPGVRVVVPSTPSDAAGLLLGAIEDPNPVVMMEPIQRSISCVMFSPPSSLLAASFRLRFNRRHSAGFRMAAVSPDRACEHAGGARGRAKMGSAQRANGRGPCRGS